MILRELVTRWGFIVNDKPLKDMDKNVARIKDSFSGVRNAALNIGLALGGVGLSVGAFFKTIGDFEQTEIAFDTLIGDAGRAQQALADLKNFAKATPFNFSGVVESSKRLLAFGFQAEELVPIMTSLGNIAAGVGKDKLPQLILAFGQVRAATRLTGAELRQFTEAGVPLLSTLAGQLGKTEAQVQDMVSAGKIGFKDVQNALFSLTGEGGRFNRLMERQSQSLQGIFSNIVDTIQLTADKIGKAGLLKEAKAFLANALTFLEANQGEIIKNFSDAIKALIALMKNLFNIVRTGWAVFQGLSRVVGGTANAFKILGFAMAVVFGARALISVGKMIQAVVTFGFAIRAASLWAAAIPLAIGAAIVALALIAEDIFAFTEGRKSVTGLIVEALTKPFTLIKENFFKLMESLGNLPGDLMKAFTELPWEKLLELPQALWKALTELPWATLFDIPRKLLLELPQQLWDAFNALPWSKILDIPGAIGSGFSQTLGLGGATQPSAFSLLQPSPMATAAPAAGNSTYNVNSPITVNVPPGTSPDMVGGAVQTGVRESFGAILRETSRATKPAVQY